MAVVDERAVRFIIVCQVYRGRIPRWTASGITDPDQRDSHAVVVTDLQVEGLEELALEIFGELGDSCPHHRDLVEQIGLVVSGRRIGLGLGDALLDGPTAGLPFLLLLVASRQVGGQERMAAGAEDASLEQIMGRVEEDVLAHADGLGCPGRRS